MLLEGEMLRRRRYAQWEVLDIRRAGGRKSWSLVNPQAQAAVSMWQLPSCQAASNKRSPKARYKFNHRCRHNRLYCMLPLVSITTRPFRLYTQKDSYGKGPYTREHHNTRFRLNVILIICVRFQDQRYFPIVSASILHHSECLSGQASEQ